MDGWNVTEDDSFERSVAGCGGYEVVDEALMVVEYALHRNPLGFPVILGFENYRIAKTTIQIRGGFIIPALKLRFWTDEAKRLVVKLHIEVSSPEDMKLLDDNEPFL